MRGRGGGPANGALNVMAGLESLGVGVKPAAEGGKVMGEREGAQLAEVLGGPGG